MKNIYIRSLFLGIVVILISISLLTYRNLVNYIDEVSLIRHSNKVFQVVQDVLSSIKDAETGHRGYQLTRDSTYLQPYFNSLNELPVKIRKLDSLLSYNARQSKKADTLNLLIDDQFAIISQILSNAGRSSLYMDQYESRLLARGKANMSEIRAVAGRIVEEEEKTFSDRVSRETLYRNNAPIALLVYTLIALIGMTFLFIRIVEALNKRKVAEDQLKENVEALKEQQLLTEERGLLLKEAETLANMGSWKWDERTNRLIWSDGLYRIWGKSPHAFEPTWESFLQNVYEEDRLLAEEFIAKIKNKESVSELQYRIEVDGQLKYVLMVANLREDMNNRPVDILGTLIDVTTQKEAERDMLIAERLSMTGKIARTIAHEVRNPLTSLNLALEQLRDEMPQDEESLKVYSDIIGRSAGRIEQLIGEMLNSSKPRELNLALTQLPEVLDEAISLTIDRINLNQIKLEKLYERDLPRVLLDKEKMKIAFLNIIINAVEAMEPGRGILRIEAKRVDGFLIILIADNGKGISAADKERMFDPFYTAKPGGMGLGLTTAKNILSSHSATIDVKSAAPGGTSFTIYFRLPEH